MIIIFTVKWRRGIYNILTTGKWSGQTASEANPPASPFRLKAQPTAPSPPPPPTQTEIFLGLLSDALQDKPDQPM